VLGRVDAGDAVWRQGGAAEVLPDSFNDVSPVDITDQDVVVGNLEPDGSWPSHPVTWSCQPS
jgi:hypothetical protein